MTRLTSGDVCVVVGIVALAAAITTPATTWAGGGRLWDESHRLSSRQHADIEKRLASATRRLGSPIFILVADARPSETVAALAARTFNERALGKESRSNPVLLALSVRDRAAAIETGKGNAGIVPEIDSTQITSRLVRGLSHSPTEALARAIDDIFASAQATAARRRPLSPEEFLPPPDTTHMPTTGKGPSVADTDAGSADARAADGGDLAQKTTPGTPETSRRRLPIAVAVAVLLLLALALRRRHQLTVARREADKLSAPPRRPNPPRP